MPQIQKSWRNGGVVLLAIVLFCSGGCASHRTKTVGFSAENVRSNVTSTVRAEEPLPLPNAESDPEKRARAYAHFVTGLVYEWNQAPDEALKHFYEAALADSGNEELVLDVARQFIQRKSPEKAVFLLTKAAAQPDASGAVDAWLGVAHNQLNHNVQAIVAFRTALKKDPCQILASQSLAQSFFSSGQARQAIKVLEAAAHQTTDDPGYYVDLADALVHFRNLAGAEGSRLKQWGIDALNSAEKLKPEDVAVRQRIAERYADLGLLDKASDTYAQLLKENPSLPALREKLADVYLRNNDKKHAIELLEGIVRQNPNNPQACYLLGVLASETRDFKKAIDYFQRTILLNPGFEPVYYDLAGMQIADDQAEAALSTLTLVRERFSQTFLLEFYSALARSRMKQYPQALSHMTRAEVIATGSETNRLTPVFFFEVGSIHERMGEYDEAEKYFRKVLSMSPNDPEAMNYLGYMWADRGVKLEESRQLIEKALKLDPDNPAYLDSEAWVLYKLKKYKEALNRILKAISLSPKPDPTLYEHLGDIYMALNQPSKAAEVWKKSLEVEANDAVKKKLDAIASKP
jgi:tetratricopeptide (TPR) repeat protein